MTPAPPRWGYTPTLLAILTCLTVWLLQQTGRLESWNGFFYDRILTWTNHWHRPVPKVLTVQVGRETELSDADGIRLLETLHALGAKGIVFTYVPARNSRPFFQRAAELQTVVFGRELRPDPDNPDSMTIEPWPAAAKDLQSAWGVVYLHPGLRGVYRWQQADVLVGRNPFPTIEMSAAELREQVSLPSRTQPFLVNFLGGPGSVPTLSVARVLAGDVIPELVMGKWVLVGTGAPLPGLYTPLCSSGQTMSFLEFEANSLQTLLDGTAVHPLRGTWTLLLLMTLAVGSSLLYPRVTSAAGVRVALGFVLACVGAAAAAMTFLGIWIPLGSLFLAQAGQFAFTLVLKTRLKSRALRDVRLRTLKRIRERFSIVDSQLTSEQWDQLADMVAQMLGVQRMVLLERAPETTQLRETKIFNCGFDDVLEKARILEAPFFAEALAKGTPVRVQAFFTTGEVPEQEFLCPLIHTGEVIGFWGIAINASRCPSTSELEPALVEFSRHIARLSHFGRRNAARRTLAARVNAWFSSEKEDQTYQELKSTADSLEQYYDVLEVAFNQIGSATVVYDFFGDVLKANDLSLTLLDAEHFSPKRSTAVQFLRLVTGNDESQVQRLLRTALLEGLPASLPIKLVSQGARQFVLRVNPLMENAPAGPTPGLSKVRGTVCEIIETTSLSTLSSLKGLVADRLGAELRGHLASIEMSASLLESDSFPALQRSRALEVIRQKSQVCAQVISECQRYLGRDVDAANGECFPVEVLELLDQVCADMAPTAAERKVTLKIDQPRLMAQVLASTDELARLFSTIIALLLKDSAENTTLKIEVENMPSISSFHFVNRGFGIPNERLQTILASPQSPAAEGFQVLRQAAVWVRDWGGHFEMRSDVGKGYSVTLRLRQFSLTPPSPAKA